MDNIKGYSQHTKKDEEIFVFGSKEKIYPITVLKQMRRLDGYYNVNQNLIDDFCPKFSENGLEKRLIVAGEIIDLWTGVEKPKDVKVNNTKYKTKFDFTFLIASLCRHYGFSYEDVLKLEYIVALNLYNFIEPTMYVEKEHLVADISSAIIKDAKIINNKVKALNKERANYIGRTVVRGISDLVKQFGERR